MNLTRGLLGLSKAKVVIAVVGVLAASLAGAVALGAVGAPSVERVDNRFGEVTNETTVVHTDLVVDNPNPVGVRLGDAEIDYTVRMNGVPMAEGGGEGIDLRAGNSTQEFRTEMNNTRIPPWWRSHVEDDERTDVTVDATVRVPVFGEREFNVTQRRTVETDLIGAFNSEETRPIEAENPPPTANNPILYVNRTAAEWGEVTERETPIDMQFVVYNPQLEPYTITELGYEITMNDVRVGEGRSEEPYVIPGGETETLNTRTIIRNQRLDEWWVTHLRNDQVTDLRIEFYARVELPTGETIRVPLEELTYEETIRTDIFDNKEGRESGDGDAEGAATPTPSPTPTSTEGDATPTATPTPTEAEGDGTETPIVTPTDGDDGVGL